jgi:hypothetical protein
VNEMAKKSFLTDQQIRVLRLRKKGMTQQEVAEELGTTRVNVTIIEKRAKLNIERSRETLKEWKEIIAPLSIKILKSTDVLRIPKLVFEETDRVGIKVKLNSLQIIAKIEDEMENKIRNRAIIDDMEVIVSNDGEIRLH